MAQNKSSNPTVNSIVLKAKADKCLSQITTEGNIYAPWKIDRKKELIDDITNSLDKDILRQVKEAIDDFSCLLLIGNKDKSKLAACYAHCIRGINDRNFSATYRTYSDRLREQGKYNRLNIYLPEINKYAFFKYESCFGESLMPSFGDDVKEWMDWFSYGYTVFLHRLELKKSEYDSKRTGENFIRSLETARANMPTGATGLFIISIDSESDLSKDLREEFKPISLDGEGAGKQPEGEDGRKKPKAKKGKLRTGGKKVYIPDKELKPFLNGILKEFEGSSHSLSDLAGITHKRIEEKWGLRKRKTDLKEEAYYKPSRLRWFLSNLRSKGQLR